MMTLTQAKQTIRKMRVELSKLSNENLETRIHLNPLYKDGQTKEFWELLRLQRHLEQKLLDTRLGVKRSKPDLPRNVWADRTVHVF